MRAGRAAPVEGIIDGNSFRVSISVTYLFVECVFLRKVGRRNAMFSSRILSPNRRGPRRDVPCLPFEKEINVLFLNARHIALQSRKAATPKIAQIELTRNSFIRMAYFTFSVFILGCMQIFDAVKNFY